MGVADACGLLLEVRELALDLGHMLDVSARGFVGTAGFFVQPGDLTPDGLDLRTCLGRLAASVLDAALQLLDAAGGVLGTIAGCPGIGGSLGDLVLERVHLGQGLLALALGLARPGLELGEILGGRDLALERVVHPALQRRALLGD